MIKLPVKCRVEYYENYLTIDEANQIFSTLMELEELITPVILNAHGNKVEMNFGKVMFVDKEHYESNRFDENIWGNIRPWPEILLGIKNKIEQHTNLAFGACVAIYYKNGDSGVSYHSDYIAFGPTDIIPSVSLGEEREFLLRENKTNKVSSIILNHGSMILMGEGCQEEYEHSLPVDKKYTKPRINLTFRQVQETPQLTTRS